MISKIETLHSKFSYSVEMPVCQFLILAERWKHYDNSNNQLSSTMFTSFLPSCFGLVPPVAQGCKSADINKQKSNIPTT